VRSDALILLQKCLQLPLELFVVNPFIPTFVAKMSPPKHSALAHWAEIYGWSQRWVALNETTHPEVTKHSAPYWSNPPFLIF